MNVHPYAQFYLAAGPARSLPSCFDRFFCWYDMYGVQGQPTCILYSPLVVRVLTDVLSAVLSKHPVDPEEHS